MPSKKTLLVVGIAIILGAIVLFLNRTQPPQDGDDTKALLQTTQSPDYVTKAFYDSYQECLKNPPTAASGMVSNYCQANTGYTTSSFIDNLNAGGIANAGADPILCSQNPPNEISIGNVETNGDTATVFVREAWGQIESKLTVSLVKQNSQWLVENITCPTP